jgi:hypothetical protein
LKHVFPILGSLLFLYLGRFGVFFLCFLGPCVFGGVFCFWGLYVFRGFQAFFGWGGTVKFLTPVLSSWHVNFFPVRVLCVAFI